MIEELNTIELNDHKKDPDILISKCIDEIGWGQYQKSVFLLCGLGLACDSMYMQSIGVIQLQVQKEFMLTNTTSSLLVTFMLLGMMLGAAFWGIFSDIVGRRIPFTAALLICAFFTSFSSLAPNYYTLSIAIRNIFALTLVIMGFGIGGNMPIDMFLNATPKSEQSLVTNMFAFWPLGQVVTSALAWIIIPVPELSCLSSLKCSMSLNLGWRLFQASLASLTFLFLIARVCCFTLYESPKFLVSRKKYQEAADILINLAKMNGKQINVDAYSLKLDTKLSDSKTQSALSITKELFAPEIRLKFLLFWSIFSTTAIGNFMFFTCLPKFISINNGADELTLNETYKNYFIVSIFSVLGSVAGVYASGSFLGKKHLMAISAFGVASALFLFTILKTSTGQLIATCIAGALQNCMFGVLHSYTPEFFPNHVRSTAVGVFVALGRFAGCFAPLITGYLLDYNVNSPVYVSSMFFLAAGICMLSLPLDTRGKEPQ